MREKGEKTNEPLKVSNESHRLTLSKGTEKNIQELYFIKQNLLEGLQRRNGLLCEERNHVIKEMASGRS